MMIPKIPLLLALGATAVAQAANPVMSGADPHVAVIDGKIWMYPTRGRGGANFLAFESRDLVRWKDHGPVLDFRDIPWIHEEGRPDPGPWAPCIAVKDGKYYFYYSVGPQTGQHPARIGVGVGRSPKGPFKDSGKALLTGGDGFEAIDPMVFEDPKSGRFLFYAGGSAGSTLRIFEMNPDMVSFAREIRTKNPEKFTEGAFMHFYDGMYHLTYSHGNFRNATYSVHYSTANRPQGPWRYRGVLLESDDRHKGPGHHSLFSDEKGQWYIAYHRWNNREGRGPFSGGREIAFERIEYKNGVLQPVKMTDEGVKLDRR